MESRKIRLKQLLQTIAKGYASNSDLARAMDIPIQAFGTYIRGTSFPEGENFRKIADYLQLSVDELNAELLGIDPKSLRAKEKGEVYQVSSKKAADLIPIAAQLSNAEKLILVKYLVNAL